MKAITLWRPWPWAIVVGGKPVENRPWSPPSSIIGTRILLHNGQGWDAKMCMEIQRLTNRPVPPPESCSLMDAGRIVASAVVAGAVQRNWSTGAAVSVGPFRKEDTFDPFEVLASPWAYGPWCWVLRDVREESGPVVRGYQRLWESPWKPQS